MEYGFCFGSNQGDRLEIFRAARRSLCDFPDTQELVASPVYETEPVGVKEEYKDLPYLNSVLVLQSSASADTWLERLQGVEAEFGRRRQHEDRFAPRTLDIDMLYCDDEIIDSGGLIVPHPRWAERRFVIQPLADVRPDKLMPDVGKTVREILDALDEDKAVQELSKEW